MHLKTVPDRMHDYFFFFDLVTFQHRSVRAAFFQSRTRTEKTIKNFGPARKKSISFNPNPEQIKKSWPGPCPTNFFPISDRTAEV